MSRRAFRLTKRMLRNVDAAKREQDRRTHRHDLRMQRHTRRLWVDYPSWVGSSTKRMPMMVHYNRERRRARHRDWSQL